MSDEPPPLFEDGEIAGQPNHIIKRAFAAYNAAARAAGWPETANLTESRQKRIKVAIRDCGGLAGWELALARAAKSDFLCGKTKSFRAPTGFKGTKLDFFLRADRRTSLLDGEYDNRAPSSEPAPGKSFQQRMSAAARPGKPQELPFVQTETREERMRATILIYRKYGRHKDANRVEDALAVIEGRPPELVPAPDAKDPDNVPPARAKPPPYHAPPRRSEAEITRAMAAAQDVPWEDIPESPDYGGDE